MCFAHKSELLFYTEIRQIFHICEAYDWCIIVIFRRSLNQIFARREIIPSLPLITLESNIELYSWTAIISIELHHNWWSCSHYTFVLPALTLPFKWILQAEQHATQRRLEWVNPTR
jgi:hypothetical protein